MPDKTGIQMIEEILGSQAVMDRRLQVVEQLLKQLLATANQPAPAVAATISAPQPAACSVPEQPLIRAAPNARVIGKIMDGGKPVPEVNITIHDDKDHPVRKTRTNRSGEWQAALPPGRYAAECLLEGRVNGNVVFSVGDGDKIVRVGQPQ
jgi:hypothetical protein